MNGGLFGFVDIVLLASIAALNFFFFYMWHILRGTWYSISPTWEWVKDVKELRKLSLSADSEELRQTCKFVLKGIYVSSGILFVGILFELFYD